MDYLLKPFDQESFRKTLARVRPRHAQSGAEERQALLASLLAQLERGVRPTPSERGRLLAEFNGKLHVIDVAQVEMIEADRNYVSIRVGRETYHARSTLSEAEQALRSQPMLRISRSCLVNVGITCARSTAYPARGLHSACSRAAPPPDQQRGLPRQVRDYLGTMRLTPPLEAALR